MFLLIFAGNYTLLQTTALICKFTIFVDYLQNLVTYIYRDLYLYQICSVVNHSTKGVGVTLNYFFYNFVFQHEISNLKLKFYKPRTQNFEIENKK